MPKPIYGAAGTGMHANVSLFRDSENAFSQDPDAPTGISDLAKNFIGRFFVLRTVLLPLRPYLIR